MNSLKTRAARWIAAPLAAVMFATSFNIGIANAGLVSTDAVAHEQAASADRERVLGYFEREDIRSELSRFGVDPVEAEARIGALSDAELSRLAGQIDTDPATTARDREHVTVRIRENEGAYRTHRVSFPEALHRPHFDLSVDTPADLDRVRALYAALESHGWPADTAHICRLLDDRDGPPSQITDLAS